MVRSGYVELVRWMDGWMDAILVMVSGGDVESLLEMADGILLIGAPSNLHPSHFGEQVLDPSLPLDTNRDAWTLPLIPLALERGIPLLGICRGNQEMNVALGGSLHQAIHQVAGLADHREPDTDDQSVRFGLAHEITVVQGSRLHSILGESLIKVNSVHGQGINRLAEGLEVEATSPDGVIEAVSMSTAAGFNLGVQWHPEWMATGSPFSQRIFGAFGEACRLRRSRRPFSV